MNSSGMKRGLAFWAVSALAVTGVATSAPAVASTGASQAGGDNNVIVIGQGIIGQSTTFDGVNTTVRLESVGGSNVDEVRFQWKDTNAPASAYQDIATVSRNDDGYFSTEWDAPAAANNADIDIRVLGLDTTGVVIPGATDVKTREIYSVTAQETMNITDGSSLGVFQQPYAAPNDGQQVVVTGTTSDPGVGVEYGWFDDSVPDEYAGGPVAVVSDGDSTFGGLLDITGYDFAATDQILINGYSNLDADSEGYTLYKQVITTVTAVADSANEPTNQGAVADNVTVTVNDQNGNPIGGALVGRVGDVATVLTDENGQATFTQDNGTENYYAEASATPQFDPNTGDKQSAPVTVTQYVAVPTTLDASSNDGLAYDRSEYKLGDLSVQIKDQRDQDFDPGPAAGNPTLPQTLNYRWTTTPFNGGAAVVNTGTVAVEDEGSYTIPQPSVAGTSVLNVSLAADANGNGAIAASDVLTVKQGQATIELTQSDPIQAPAGGQSQVTGSEELPDGTGLPGRNIDLSYNQGAETGPNGGAADAGLLVNGNVVQDTQVTTDADGEFTAVVKDPAETPQAPETGGNVIASSAPTELGDEQPPTNATPVSNTNAAPDSIGVDFLGNLTPAVVRIDPNANRLIDNQAGPGRPVSYRVRVLNNDDPALPLTNVDVTLSTNAGFFTPYAANEGDLTPAAAPAAGADYGVWENDGTTTTVTTDGNGFAYFTLAIEKNAGFDDDGEVTATVTATAGSASDTQQADFTSSDPLNAGTVTISRAGAEDQTVGILPKAPTNESVAYDVFATDQFGNLVGGEPIPTTQNLAGGSITGTGISQFLGQPPTVALDSNVAGNATPRATWTSEQTTYEGAPPAKSTGDETVNDIGEVTNWYVISFAQSTFSLTHDTANSVPVSSTVIETYTAIDQNGEPIFDVGVDFFRTGPDVLQDGTPAQTTFNAYTDQNGRATYVFSGTAAGTARIEALITDSDDADGTDNQPVSSSRAADQVVFTGSSPVQPPTGTPTTPPTQTQQAIDAKLTGSSKGRRDKIKVDAGAVANGAKVTLYKKVKGELVELKVKTLNSAGQTNLGARDRNGNKVTKYVVVVDQTSDSAADRSKTRIK